MKEAESIKFPEGYHPRHPASTGLFLAGGLLVCGVCGRLTQIFGSFEHPDKRDIEVCPACVELYTKGEKIA